jgi:hypothetical protein
VRSANDSTEDLELYRTRNALSWVSSKGTDSAGNRQGEDWAVDSIDFHYNNARDMGNPIPRDKSLRKLPEGSDFLPSVTSTAELTLIVESIDNLILHQWNNWSVAIRDKTKRKP